MKPSVYLETSIVSYHTARQGRNPIALGRQAVTRHWWAQRLPLFRAFVSDFVMAEAAAGDPNAARLRLAALAGIPLLDITPPVEALAQSFVRAGIVPKNKALDAYHVSVAAVHSVDYLLTWNCAHIANAEMRGAISRLCADLGFASPVICTPEELMGVKT